MMISIKNIRGILVLAILLKIILAAAGFHPDIQAFNLGGWVVGQGNVFNLYDYIASLPKTDLIARNYPADFFIYPPVIYFYHGLFSFLFNTLGLNFGGQFLSDINQALGSWQFNFHLILLKSPYLFFDFSVAFLLARFFQTKKEQMLVITFWLFNPVNLYVTYLMGQFDVIPTFFVILALYLATTRRFLPAIILGLGAAFKIYPLFFLVPLASLENSWIKKLQIISLGLLTYLLTILPFLFSKGFRSSALVSNLTLKSLYPQIPVSGGESILLFMAFVVFFYLIFWHRHINASFLWRRFFVILLLFFIFTHYHPQWFLWLTPFFILDTVKSNFKNVLPVILMLFSFTGLLFFFDSGLTLGLFAPVAPGLYNSPTIWQILHISVDYNFLRSILQTIFAGSAFYYIYDLFQASAGEGN